MELTVYKRKLEKKGEVRKIRRNGGIPAILYGGEEKNESIYVEKREFEAILRKLQKKSLATTIFTLKNGKSKVRSIIKGIQYGIVTYDIIHLDFERLFDEVWVEIDVPIEFTGEAECEGIKLGGSLKPVIRKLKVRCLPKDIPEKFQIDVKEMKRGESKRLSDIVIPSNVYPVDRMREVAVVIG